MTVADLIAKLHVDNAKALDRALNLAVDEHCVPYDVSAATSAQVAIDAYLSDLLDAGAIAIGEYTGPARTKPDAPTTSADITEIPTPLGDEAKARRAAEETAGRQRRRPREI